MAPVHCRNGCRSSDGELLAGADDKHEWAHVYDVFNHRREWFCPKCLDDYRDFVEVAIRKAKGSATSFSRRFGIARPTGTTLVDELGIKRRHVRSGSPRRTSVTEEAQYQIYLSLCVDAGRILAGPQRYKGMVRKWFAESGFKLPRGRQSRQMDTTTDM